jgi:hypothetical protein
VSGRREAPNDLQMLSSQLFTLYFEAKKRHGAKGDYVVDTNVESFITQRRFSHFNSMIPHSEQEQTQISQTISPSEFKKSLVIHELGC